MNYLNPMLDKEFLKQLDNYQNKIIYAKVIALTKDEYPTQEITGLISSGNINVDGNSAIRRTCSLTLIANLGENSIDINNYYWGLNTKFKLSIGVKNEINDVYDDIIWFDQGIFLITNFTTSINTNSFNINISGKDKMSLLNGDISGVIPSEVCFGVLDEYDEENDSKNVTPLPLKTIIQEAVHVYGGEDYKNIIINDLDDYGKEVLEYYGNDDVYLIKHWYKKDFSYTDIKTGNEKCYIIKNGSPVIITLDQVPVYDSLNNGMDTGLNITLPTKIWFTNEFLENNYYVAIKITKGTVIGYRQTELTYPNAENLILKAGDNVNTLLDKITKTFGDYEYFYNTKGQFVFQKKKIYLNTSFNNLHSDFETGEVYGDSMANTSAITYSFEDNNLITTISNTPNLSNLKNDFICWGTRKSSTSGEDLPIHLRYSLDDKPLYYMSIPVTIEEIQNNTILSEMPYKKRKINQILEKNPLEKQYQKSHFYFTKEWYSKQSKDIQKALSNYEFYDWREILYQMSYDYNQYGVLDNFNFKLQQANSKNYINKYFNNQFIVSEDLYVGGKTNYERYYTDIISFWRQLYNINLPFELTSTSEIESKELYVKDEYHLITSTSELLEKSVENPIYIKRKYNNNWFLTPLLDSVFINCTTIDNKMVLQGNMHLYTNDKNDNKTQVNILNGINKKDLYFKIGKNKYYKLDEYLISNNSIAIQTDYFICTENENNRSVPSSLQDAIKNNLVYYKADTEEVINPILYYDKDKFLFNKYCNIDEGGLSLETINKIKELDSTSETYNDDLIAIISADSSFCYRAENPTYEFEIDGWHINSNKMDLTEKNNFQKKFFQFITEEPNKYWHYNVIYNPSQLNFWLDFIDVNGPINKYNINNIGDRLKVDNNKEVKAIYYEEIPNIIFHNKKEYEELVTEIKQTKRNSLRDSSGYDHIKLTERLSEELEESGRGISAKDAVDSLLYNYLHCNETISLTAIPIYYLEPNTRIYVYDNKTNISGQYIINKISYQLGHNGTMNISATKAIQRIN